MYYFFYVLVFNVFVVIYVYLPFLAIPLGFLGGSHGKEYNAGDLGLIPGWGRPTVIVNTHPLFTTGIPIPVFQRREFHGQRSLSDYSLWDCKELNTNERLTFLATSLLWLIFVAVMLGLFFFFSSLLKMVFHFYAL